MNKEIEQLIASNLNRRSFLQKASIGLGTVALGSLLSGQNRIIPAKTVLSRNGILGAPDIPARTKRVVYLFQSGGPSQFETFEYKPMLEKMHGQDLPDSVRKGQRLTGMSAQQSALPLVGSSFKFEQKGKSGAWASELMPYTGAVADDLCFIKSMYTDQINHDSSIDVHANR